MRKDSSFDSIIREKLDRVAPVAPYGDWERLVERMHQDSGSEQEDASFFDRLVREKTSASHYSDLNKNWASLVGRLDRIYQRERQLLGSKIIELAALFLLLLIMERDYFGSDDHFSAFKALVSKAESSLPSSNTSHASAAAIVPAIPTAKAPVAASVKFSLLGIKQADAFFDAAGISSPADRPVVRLQSVVRLPSIPISDLHMAMTAEQPLARPEAEAYEQQKQPLRRRIDDLPSPHSGGTNVITVANRQLAHVSLSMFGGAEINYIQTPEAPAGPTSEFDRTPLILPGYYRYAGGYTGGVTVAYGKGRIELETGLIYTAKQYQARQVLYVTGSVQDGFRGEGIKDIEMNIAAIPLNLRYDLFRNSNWRFYGGLGGSMQVVLDANYSVAGQDAFRSTRFNPLPADVDGSGVLKSIGLSSKNLAGGWLQGGSITDNTFFAASASLGVERSFHSGWSFFAQPTYHHSLLYLSKGLGPDNERLHTFSVYTGVRIRL